MSKVINVLPVSKAAVRDESQFEIINPSDCSYPVYLEKHLTHLIDKAVIDIAGWSSFRRLILLEA